MDHLNEYVVFVTVVRTGSFAAAAEKLFCTPSGLSKKLSRLEHRLRAPLLVRTTRSLELTKDGEHFYRNAIEIVEKIRQAERALKNKPATMEGVIRIQSSPAFAELHLSNLLPEFMDLYPAVRVELTLHNSLDRLRSSETDLVIRSSSSKEADLIACKLADNPWVICAAPRYLTKYGAPEMPEDLSAHRCLLFNEQCSSSEEWLFAGASGTAGVASRIAVEGTFASFGSMVLRMAIKGKGIARLANFLVAPEIQRGRLVPLLTRYMPRDLRGLYIYYSKPNKLDLKSRAFVAFMQSKMKPSPPWERI